MTALSTLFPPASGGAEIAYQSGQFYPVTIPNNWAGTTASAGRDYMIPFVPRIDVTIDEVGWDRVNATAANVYVGIYSAAGSLLTDCAVDADTTAGFHAVSTTPVDLSGGELYYMSINQSAAVINADQLVATDKEFEMNFFTGVAVQGFNVDATTFPTSTPSTLNMYKTRANAALPASQTMSSFTADYNRAFMLGFVPS